MATSAYFTEHFGRLTESPGKALTIKNGLQKADLIAKRKKPMSPWDAGLFVHAFTQNFGHADQVAKWAEKFTTIGMPRNMNDRSVLSVFEMIFSGSIPCKDIEQTHISKYDGTTIFRLREESEVANRLGKTVDIFYPDSRKEWDENPLHTEEYFVIYPMWLMLIHNILIQESDGIGRLVTEQKKGKWFTEIEKQYGKK
jgi:hypothetical protein